MFFDGVRISTLVTVLVYMAVTVRKRDWTVMVACLAWLGGFEIAYQLTALAMGQNRYPLAAPIFVLIGVAFLAVARWARVAPSWRWITATLVVFGVWVATGFHANQAELGGPIDAWSEVLNEATKTLWALAYLAPLWPRRAFPPLRRRTAS